MVTLPTGLEERGDVRREADPRSAGTLFQLIRDGRPRTRADLAAVTGFARPTVAARIDELLSSGLIVPAGEASSTGGRPPATFAFNPGARIILAADLGVSHGRLAITDLASAVLSERSLEIAIADGPQVVLDAVTTALCEMVEDLGRPVSDVAGVGIGLPGPVEHRLGRAISPPIMPGWDGFDVPGHVAKTLPTPVLVDNDVNIMALGEHAARWQDVKDLVFIKIATGIGAGIISDGELRRGALGAAGDLGHIAVPRGRQIPCRCGNVGCLEALASGLAVVESLRAQGVDIQRTAQIVDLVRSGNITASQTVRQAGRDIGDVVAGCVNLLNPSVIVIGGIVSEVGEHLLAGIREVVYSRSLPLATQHLRIVASQTEGRAGVLGASQMVSQQVLSAPAIDQLLMKS
ncbi:ROK family transcriptional regulator [Oceanitalea stevensii]|uniref:ROK family transcriptional regulator n=1 Tax=Oceanitalea stevensii TaxID=2763072 RepID=A0ABR8Z485_9MICO|nr:ROK family transcriptional regulator [Oceanitalea stevensii]MBD8063125.1 ROK family transcriptional regulator [Oceanitalea stevensii]